MLLPSQTLTAQVWTPALSQTKTPAASHVNSGLLSFQLPMVSCTFLLTQGFAGSATVLEGGKAAWFMQPGFWHAGSMFFLLLTSLLITPALVPKAPVSSLKKYKQPFVRSVTVLFSLQKSPSTHARRTKQLCPGENLLEATLGAHPLSPQSILKGHQPATCSGRNHTRWLRSERTLSQMGAEEQKVNHNVSSCILKTKWCELATCLYGGKVG